MKVQKVVSWWIFGRGLFYMTVMLCRGKIRLKTIWIQSIYGKRTAFEVDEKNEYESICLVVVAQGFDMKAGGCRRQHVLIDGCMAHTWTSGLLSALCPVEICAAVSASDEVLLLGQSSIAPATWDNRAHQNWCSTKPVVDIIFIGADGIWQGGYL